MSEAAIAQNTLVSLPTGMGKTLIAAVVMYNYYRWFPTGKVIFCAPTRPLVSQQIQACYRIMGVPEHHTAEISGRSKPEARANMWRKKRVFFCTPQTLVIDIRDQRCPAKSIVCVVMDEAHRATKDHANNQLVRQINEAGARYRFVGLSATPGATIEAVQTVIKELNISRVECRTESDPDVKQYIHHREEELIIVKQPDIVKSLDSKIAQLMKPVVGSLCENVPSKFVGAFYNSSNLNPYMVMTAQRNYQQETQDFRFKNPFNVLRELVNVRQQLKGHGVQMAKNRLADFVNKPYMAYMVKQPAYQSLMREMGAASGDRMDGLDGDGAVGSDPGTFQNNPKLMKLAEVLSEHFERKRAINESTRAIVFSQWRESVGDIVKMLATQPQTCIKPAQFIGQASKRKPKEMTASLASAGQDAAGMNQKQQQRVLQQFNQGTFNVLVCTCVGEEGLDIGEVDLIVNFDVMKSPIRSIQRSGRTGRKRDGRVVSLIAEGQEERSHFNTLEKKRTLERALSNPGQFKLCEGSCPMLPGRPELLRKKMNVNSFHLSQVGGHTPKGRGRSGRTGGPKKAHGKNKVSESTWRLNPAQEQERRRLFGHLPRSSCRESESRSSAFPVSLKRKYLSSRRQSIYTRMSMSVGKSSKLVHEFERRHCKSIDADTKEELASNSDSDCNLIDVSSNGSVVCEKYEEHSVRSETSSNSSDNALTHIFGPIFEEESGTDPSQIMDLFDAEHHKNCTVIAPPGMVLDESEDESDSSSSVLSEISKHDDCDAAEDLCAFFDGDNSIDQKVCSEDGHLATKTPFSDQGSVDDLRSDDHCGSINFEDVHCDNEDDVAISKVAKTRKYLESTLVIDGNSTSLKQVSKSDIGKENINAQLPLNPAGQDDVFQPKHTHNKYVKEDSGSHTLPPDYSNVSVNEQAGPNVNNNGIIHEKAPKNNINSQLQPNLDCQDDEVQSKHTHGIHTKEDSVPSNEDTHKNVGGPNRRNNQLIHEEVVDPGMTSFHLLSPQKNNMNAKLPRSHAYKDDECQSKHAHEKCAREDFVLPDDTNVLPNERIDDTHTNVGASNSNNNEVILEEVLDPVVTSFHLPTPPPSSEESDDDCDTSVIAQRDNVHKPIQKNLFETNEPFEETGIEEPLPCFELPTQYSSEDSSEDDSVQSENGPSDQTSATAGIAAHGSSKGQSQADRCLSGTRRVHFKATSFAADGLTDTPIKPLSSVNDNNKAGSKTRMSLDSLTDTPLQYQKSNRQPRKSLDSLTDTPIQRRVTATGQQRKRLRPAHKDVNTNMLDMPESRSTDNTQRKDRLKKRIEDKYRCRFLDCEAVKDGSEESDEESDVKRIEDEELSQDSFINDTSQLGYTTQDDLDNANADAEIVEIEETCDHGGGSLLHRQLDNQQIHNEQFKTPIFNRRMKNSVNQSQHTESTQKGLGNMHFIRSVLEHAAAGGNADHLEEEYHRLAAKKQSQELSSESDSEFPTDPGQTATPKNQGNNSHIKRGSSGSIHIGFELQQQVNNTYVQSVPAASSIAVPSSQAVTLTEEQRAMIEAKRIAALRRRQQRMKQNATPSNPYSK